MSATQYDTVHEYLASFPDDVQQRLRAVQDRIRAAAPGCDEVISYGMPTMRLEGRLLVHFAGWKNHISIYPTPDDLSGLEPEVTPYVAGRGTLKFPHDQPLPLELVERVAHALVLQNRG